MEIISKKEAKERGLKRYFTGKPCKHGHIAERLVSSCQCCECGAKWKKEYRQKNKDKVAGYQREYHREYQQQNKDKIAEYNREWHAKNKDKIAEQRREHRKQNKDKLSERQREWYAKNKDKIAEQRREYYNKNKDKISKREKERYKQNPVPYFIRSSLNRIFTNWKGSRKKMEKLHGYTFEQLVTRIEFQFKDGMSWDNRSEWHIDHKKPISRFLEQGVTDPKIINALSNLQPMWASENLSKGAKFEL